MPEHIGDSPAFRERVHLANIYAHGREHGSFGELIDSLTYEQILDLKVIVDSAFLKEIENLPALLPRRRNLLSRLFKRNESDEQSSNSDRVDNMREVFTRLNKELEQAIKKHDELRRIEAKRPYMDRFVDFIRSLDGKQLGPNVTVLTVTRYVRSENRQLAPGQDEDGMVVISEKATFEENLQFVREHICSAKIINNLRGR